MKTLHYPAFGKRCAMKIENGKIVEATVSELYDYYLAREWFEVYSFPHYKRLCKELGAKIVDKEMRDAD